LTRPAKSTLKIQIDGAARGNPGPAGIGAVLSTGPGRKVSELAVYLGEATNNVAEHCALILALQEALKRGSADVAVFSDSELLVRQVNGEYRVKDKQLQWLHVLIRQLVEGFSHFEIRHVPREENRAADCLANRAVTDALRRRPTSKKKQSTPSAPSAATQPTFW